MIWSPTKLQQFVEYSKYRWYQDSVDSTQWTENLHVKHNEVLLMILNKDTEEKKLYQRNLANEWTENLHTADEKWKLLSSSGDSNNNMNKGRKKHWN